MNYKGEGVKNLQILHTSGTDRLSEIGTNRVGGSKDPTISFMVIA